MSQRSPRGAALAFLALSVCSAFPALASADSRAAGAPLTWPIGFYQKYLSDLRYGRCYFAPSCSQYARDAIEERGFLVGAALSADRLVRCNASARLVHARDESGHLIDPVQGTLPAGGRPALPGWMLPSIPEIPALPQASTGPDASVETITDTARFARALEDEGDCWRATTEYKRLAFLAERPSFDYWAQMRIAWCSFKHGEPAESGPAFLRAALLAPSAPEQSEALFMAAAAHFDAGHYARCRRVLDELMAEDPGPAPDASAPSWARSRILRGLTDMAGGDWTAAEAQFSLAGGANPDSRLAGKALSLRPWAEGGRSLV